MYFLFLLNYNDEFYPRESKTVKINSTSKVIVADVLSFHGSKLVSFKVVEGRR